MRQVREGPQPTARTRPAKPADVVPKPGTLRALRHSGYRRCGRRRRRYGRRRGDGMKIDRRAEALAREALAGVIGRERERVSDAFQAVEDDEMSKNVTAIALAVLREALTRVYRGVPSERQNAELAAEIASSESWADIKTDEVRLMLEAVSTEQRLLLPDDRLVATL